MAKKIRSIKNSKTKGTCFITGANGRLGKILIKKLIKEGYTVRVLVKRNEYLLELPAGTIPYIGDINDVNVLEKGCEGVDYVFHLAALVNTSRVPIDEILNTNVFGTKNLLKAAVKNKVKRFIFTSSLDVYGIERKGMLNESSKLDPKDKYGYSKMLAEEEIKSSSGKMKYTILRFATIYGLGFEGSFFKIFKGIQNNKIYLIGGGENHLSLIYIDDAINALVLSIEKDGKTSETLNISDGRSYTQKELFNIAADMLGVDRPTKRISKFLVKIVATSRNLDSDELRFITSNRVVDISKAKKVLNFIPKVFIEEGGMQLVEEFKKQKYYS
jgi:nucleoside-diphosphate-sugar epimerase